jgi:hypothetical protein
MPKIFVECGTVEQAERSIERLQKPGAVLPVIQWPLIRPMPDSPQKAKGRSHLQASRSVEQRRVKPAVVAATAQPHFR